MRHGAAMAQLIVVGIAAFVAGVMNALAGGGSFITFPALLFAGLDPRAANITSTVALFPGQVSTAFAGRGLIAGAARLSFKALMAISLAGGVLGALLLLATPAAFFARLVPWLVLFATAVFAWGSFAPRRAPASPSPIGRETRFGAGGAAATQFAIAIYGGYFGGGIGFLMLAALTVAGVSVRTAGATKNALSGAMNASAVLIFLFSGEVAWAPAGVAAITAIGGGLGGAWLLRRVNERALRVAVVCVGVALTIGLFLRQP